MTNRVEALKAEIARQQAELGKEYDQIWADLQNYLRGLEYDITPFEGYSGIHINFDRCALGTLTQGADHLRLKMGKVSLTTADLGDREYDLDPANFEGIADCLKVARQRYGK